MNLTLLHTKTLLVILCLAFTVSCGERTYSLDNLEVHCFGNNVVKEFRDAGDYFYRNRVRQKLYRCPADKHIFSISALYSTPRQLLMWDGETIAITFSRELSESDISDMRERNIRMESKPRGFDIHYLFSVKSLQAANLFFEEHGDWVTSVEPVFREFTGF